MKKRLFSAVLATAVLFGLTACFGNKPTDSENTVPEAGGVETPAEFDEADTPDLVEEEPAGVVKWLCYHDIVDDNPNNILAMQRFEALGGSVEYELCGSNAAYFERLGVLVVSDDSPDLVRYEWMSYPHGVTKNLYTPLDKYLDINEPLWEGVKEVVEGFSWGGKHYYFPQLIQPNFALNYNRVALGEAGFDDPYDLYAAGDWNWNTFKDLLMDWCAQGPDYVGYRGVGGMSFVATTGMPGIKVTEDGQILNNVKTPEVQRCMEFLEGLYKEGLSINDEWVGPEDAFVDGTLLFLGMAPLWTHKAAQESLVKKGVENDLAVLPFPRDPNADDYYHAFDTFGYMIPNGAGNIKGALDWIKITREIEIDPERLAKEKDDALSSKTTLLTICQNRECRYDFKANNAEDLTACPECGEPRKERFKEIYTEDVWDMVKDLCNPDKFNLLFDDVYGFGNEVTQLFEGGEDALFDGPIFHGASYSQLRDSYYQTIESLLEPYRAKLAEDMAAGD